MAESKPKTTLTLKTRTAGTATTEKGPRRYTTRAKAAARRDGRELDFGTPLPTSASAKPKPDADSSQARSKPAGKPRDTKRAGGSRDAAEPDARRRRDTGESAGDKTPTSRDPREASHDRRKSREGDRASRIESRPPRPSAPAAPPREADGLVRISKLLSEQGLCSRREADSYIARGWVWADGVRVTELGTRVPPTAKLRLDRQAAEMQESRMTVLLHKPVGYVSGQAEDGYQPASVLVTAEHQLPSDTEKFRHEVRRGLAPAGRLDIDSTGLLVLTQDGRIAKQLIGEDSDIEKEYLVRVEGSLSEADLARLNHGLELDGEALKPARVKWQNKDQLNFILKEGKKRQIRRMCELVGLQVVGLKRIRIGRVVLGDLPVGKWRFLREDEGF